MANATQRIITLEALVSSRITHASQDGSREFISLLTCICANGSALPPALIYKEDSKTLQDTWVEDVTSRDEAFFAVSSKKWSCDAIGLNWLTQIFQRYTGKKAGNRRRLLIVDGHSNHVNIKFINKCDELRILFLVLPSHSTHRLQPLNVSLFKPLASFYTSGLNILLNNNLGMVSITKRAFWTVFLPAWKQAFTPENIASDFEKTGIFPYKPRLILDVITKPPPIESPKSIKTPISCRAIRRAHRAYKFKPNPAQLAIIFRGHERAAADRTIAIYVNRGLQEALRMEKKKRRRGKRLNLLGQEDSRP